MDFVEGRDLMPRVPVPEGYTEDTWLREQVHAGLRDRFRGGPVPRSTPGRPTTRSTSSSRWASPATSW
jgi:hypothetical protein